MRKAIAAMVLSAATAVSGCGSGGGESGGIPPFWTQDGVVAADFNGDGRLDVAVAATYVAGPPPHPGFVNVYLSNASGGFDAPVQYSVATDPWGVSVGDLDGTGGLDLVVSSPATEPAQPNAIGDSGVISILRHDRANPGRFLPASVVRTGGMPYAAAIAELTGDGRPDIVVGDAVRVNARALLLAQSTTQPGTFLPPVAIPVGHGSAATDMGDLDGDGRLDVVLAAYDSVVVLYQRPGGTFDVVSLPAGLVVNGVAVADLDGDGRPDVAASNAGNAPAGGSGGASVTVLLQKAAGIFTPTNVTVPDGARWVAIGDLNADGTPDLAVVSLVFQAIDTPSHVSVLLQSPTERGHFGAPRVFEGPLSGLFIAIGDVNRDGRNDIVINDGPSVLFQSASSPGTFGPPQPLR